MTTRATPFFKASGAGNDFIVLTAPDHIPTSERVRAWCKRALSIGADGVIAIREHGKGETGHVEMVHWNADGGRSDLCLNGSRCAARLAFELGWSDGETLKLRTDAGSLHCRRTAPDRIAIELPPGMVGAPKPLTLTTPPSRADGSSDPADEGAAYPGWLLAVGVPHFVLGWSDLESLPIDSLGPRLRSHADLGEPGANIDFVRITDPNHFEIRTFERGVEAETLACGTGVVAAAVAGIEAGELRWPVRATTAGGFVLEVDALPVSTPSSASSSGALCLEGNARVVARGEILDAAEALPSAPPWSPASSAEVKTEPS